MSTELELEALFRAEKAAAPAVGTVNRGWQRLAADLAANVAPMPIATGALKLSAWLVPKWLLVGFTLGLAGAGVSASLLGAKATLRPGTAPPLPVAVASEHVALAVPVVTSEPDPPAPSPAPSAEARTQLELPALAPSSSSSSPATLDAELKLISFAKEELDAHRPRQAQAWLAEHAERFPNGLLAVEREALQTIVTCQTGQKNDSAASAFAKRHPGSPLVERIERACRSNVEFSNSPNGGAGPGEPTSEPSRGEQR